MVDMMTDLRRHTRSSVWLEDARRDLHYALRTLARTPGFTLVAVLTLALGIGSVTVIYSVIHDVLLNPLPYPGSDRFVNVIVHDTATGRSRGSLAPSEFLDYQEQSDVFEDVVGTRGESMLLATAARAEILRAVRVTPNFFDVMGLSPLIGRTAGPNDAEVYLPGAGPLLLVRTAGNPLTSLNAIRSEIGMVDRGVALRQPDTLEGLLRLFVYAQPRFSLIVLGVFAVTGTLLVAIGVFSVMAYTVTCQTREIAVRIALGAPRGQVMGVVLRAGARLLGLGVGAGLIASFAMSRLIANQLWNTSPQHPLTLALAVSVVAVVALAACYFPARRAMQVDPIGALRSE